MERTKNKNDLLREQVEREIAHLVSPPQAIRVAVDQGHVTLDGPIYEDEADRLVQAIKAMDGVTLIENRLQRQSRA